jgi:hypothetical protein
VGETRCTTTGPAAVEVCAAGGVWTIKQTCSSICSGGECAGACTPNDKQCGSDQRPATCSAQGEWTAAEPCPFVCVGKGECGGQCKPGTNKCGDGPDKLIPFSCDENGAWVAKPACTNLCMNGSCGGSCSPGTKRCVNNAIETCSALGTWDPGAACAGKACVDGVCVGACEPKALQCGSNNKVQTCDAAGAWQDTSTCSGKTCVKGVCVGSCAPDAAKRCSSDAKAVQSCGANGVWTSDETCSGGKRCSGAQCVCPSDQVPSGNGCVPKCSAQNGKACMTNTCTPGKYDCDDNCVNRQQKQCPGDLVCINAGQCGCSSNLMQGPNNTCVPKCDSKMGTACNVGTCDPGKIACNGDCITKPIDCGNNGQTCFAGKCACPTGMMPYKDGCVMKCNCAGNGKFCIGGNVVAHDVCDQATGLCGARTVETCQFGCNDSACCPSTGCP